MAVKLTELSKVAKALPAIKLVLGDITVQEVDAIVNSANKWLLAGGGVDGAIHRAAGPELELECKKFGGCEIGEAVVTSAYRLQAKHVIHAVGPRYFDGLRGEEELLEQCYMSIFETAAQLEVRSIAIPSISTGVFHFPAEKAAKIALNTFKRALTELGDRLVLQEVRFITFSEEHHGVYDRLKAIVLGSTEA